MGIAWLACKKSKAFNMKIFQALNVATGLIPVFLGMSYHFSDLYDYISGTGDEMIAEWKNFPICVLWYAFFFIALQVHAIELECLSELCFACSSHLVSSAVLV